MAKLDKEQKKYNTILDKNDVSSLQTQEIRLQVDALEQELEGLETTEKEKRVKQIEELNNKIKASTTLKREAKKAQK